MPCHIVILGAGISGLATAWFLKQTLGSDIRLTLLEKTPRVGGWIHTLQTEGFLFEQGPRSCRSKANGQATLALIEALGLQDQVLTPHPHSRYRYIFNGQSLQRMPKNLGEVPFNSLTQGWMKALWRDWYMPKRQTEDESIHAFFSRRLGSQWTERLIDPFVSGIYAGNCHELSLKSCFPLFDQWEQQHGSLIRGAWRHPPLAYPQTPFIRAIRRFPLFSFKEGMETLPKALAQHLTDCLLLKQTVKELHVDSVGIKVQLEGGKQLTADYVISTLPTFALSPLLTTAPTLGTHLQELSYTTVIAVNIGFNSEVLPIKGFGYLIPSKHHSLVLGCIWDSSIFPQQNSQKQTRLTLMMGGSHHPEIEYMSEQEILTYAVAALNQHLGICASPQLLQVKKAHQAIPQYKMGYSCWKEKTQEKIHRFSPRLIMSGSAWTGVSINDCIVHAHQLAHQIHAKLIRG